MSAPEHLPLLIDKQGFVAVTSLRHLDEHRLQYGRVGDRPFLVCFRRAYHNLPFDLDGVAFDPEPVSFGIEVTHPQADEFTPAHSSRAQGEHGRPTPPGLVGQSHELLGREVYMVFPLLAGHCDVVGGVRRDQPVLHRGLQQTLEHIACAYHHGRAVFPSQLVHPFLHFVVAYRPDLARTPLRPHMLIPRAPQ